MKNLKHIIICVFFFGFLVFESKAQILVNSKPDSLQEVAKFYYNNILKQKKLDLNEGFYFLIFDVSVNTDSTNLLLQRKSKSPILYQKSNGYYSFFVHEKSSISFNFNYSNNQDIMKLLAKLYRIPENIIGKELNSEFKIRDIYGNIYDKESFRGYTSIFFSSYRYDLSPLINSIKREYRSDSLILVSLNKDLPKDLHDHQNKHAYFDIVYVSDYLFKLNPWTNYMPKLYPAAIIFIGDDKTRLQYRNVLGIGHKVNDHDIKSDIFKVLNRVN